MLPKYLLPKPGPSKGSLVLTVDCVGGTAESNVSNSALKQLVEMFDAHGVKATWAINQPKTSGLSSFLLGSSIGHELAIRCTTDWAGAAVPRSTFLRELVSQLADDSHCLPLVARQTITSLFVGNCSVEKHLDLLVKHGLKAIVGPTQSCSNKPHFAIPKAVRYGVWDIPITSNVQGQLEQRFGGRRRLKSLLNTVVNDGGFGQLVLDASLLSTATKASQNTLVWLLRHTARLRDRGFLNLETLSETASRLSKVPEQSPQRSILRLAA